MSKAEEWAKAIHEVRLARPTFTTTVADADGRQHAGLREVAFVVALNGAPALQLRRGGILQPEGALALAEFIRDVFDESREPRA